MLDYYEAFKLKCLSGNHLSALEPPQRNFTIKYWMQVS